MAGNKPIGGRALWQSFDGKVGHGFSHDLGWTPISVDHTRKWSIALSVKWIITPGLTYSFSRVILQVCLFKARVVSLNKNLELSVFEDGPQMFSNPFLLVSTQFYKMVNQGRIPSVNRRGVKI